MSALRWMRIWLGVLIVFAIECAVLDYRELSTHWDQVNAVSYNICINREIYERRQSNALTCVRKAGVHKTLFEHENTTPRAFWIDRIGNWAMVYVGMSLAITLIYLLIRALDDLTKIIASGSFNAIPEGGYSNG